VLNWIAGVPEESVKVQVENGWVTLRGELSDADRSHRAERAISQMRSVTGVTNLIDVCGPKATDDERGGCAGAVHAYPIRLDGRKRSNRTRK
jgi:hyperosmotically inducible protein